MMFAPPKSDFIDVPAVGSMGDVSDVDDPDRGKVV
jgi:hypothetical protein